jgi:sporulation-control protein spo0M
MAFYREDDGFYRDQEIKPAWDKSLRDLDEARLMAVEMEKELELFLEAGRRAGALPGWLREGIELEPQLDEEQQPGFQTFEPVEPVVIDGDGGTHR